MTTIRVIKKYPNRRLYDTELGIYITLDEIKQLVLERVVFQVIDVKTKKDITQTTLLQIISEQEATSTPLFTTAILQDFIRFYHEKSQDLFSQYLEQAMGLFVKQKEYLKHQWPTFPWPNLTFATEEKDKKTDKSKKILPSKRQKTSKSSKP